MNNREIIDNAFGSATHVNEYKTYLEIEGTKVIAYYGDAEQYAVNTPLLNDFMDMRSLADIKELIALREENAELENECEVLAHDLCDARNESKKQINRIAELEKFISENTPLLSYLAIETVSSPVDGDPLFVFKDWLARRYLEQQAKGAEDVIESVLGEPESLTSDALSIRYEFLDRVKQLREQSKGGDV